MTTTGRQIVKGLLAIIGILLLAVVAIVAWNWTFIQRANTYPAGKDITSEEWYTPKAKVTGAFKTALPTADSLTISETALNELAEYTAANNSSALLVLHKGELLLEKYWQGNTAESTTNSMSMAKTIIGLLIGKAIEEGKIESEQELVAKYLPEWKDDARAKITIADLLYMQSGLRNEDQAGDPFSDLTWMYIGPDVQETTLAIPAEVEPGTDYDYNNANTQLLGIILERVTALPIEEYASTRLWQKIGAKDAGWWLDSPDGMPKVFCCYFARARDWVRLGRLFLQGGRWDGQQVVSKTWIQKMLVPSKLERDYGYHIWLGFEDGGLKKKERSEMYLAPTITIDGKSKQKVFIVPSQDLIVLRIGEMPANWDEAFVVNVLLRDLQKI